ncbi:MAG: iron-sulfur cluster assembly scaffold protein [Ruminococcus sp.]|nr:iron-sulfur cluster assembly scaffold protein [Ruminococcus sp.]
MTAKESLTRCARNTPASARVNFPSCCRSDTFCTATSRRNSGRFLAVGNVKFETFGCASAIASGSTATEPVKGQRVEDAIQAALEDYQNKKSKKISLFLLT